MKKTLTCFKAYDVRGQLVKELNEDVAYRIGFATAQSLEAKNLVVGFDARMTSPKLAQAVAKGIIEFGANVFDIGLAGTEEVYSAVSELKACGGIEVTASHNPIEYNGMKIVKSKSRPLSASEFFQIKHLAEDNKFKTCFNKGSIINKQKQARQKYTKKVISFVNLRGLKPLKIVINSGNGAAGPVIDSLISELNEIGIQAKFILLQHEPDPSFPNGIPNPLLEENRFVTSNAVRQENADFGVAFDGDFDRCFLFDHLGEFVPGEYIVGLLAKVFLGKEDKATIVHDPRVIWNTQHVINKFGGQVEMSKTGHSFVKAAMRKAKAIYGGEMSAHHYFRDYFYCDSGMIPWLMIWELISKENTCLADMVLDSKRRFPSSGELNFTVSDAVSCINRVKNYYQPNAYEVDQTDGLSMSFESWRFNLRKSNTEELVRLNVETKADEQLLETKTTELTRIIIDV